MIINRHTADYQYRSNRSRTNTSVDLGSRSVPEASIQLGNLLDGEIRSLNISYLGKNEVTINLTVHEKTMKIIDIKFQIFGCNNMNSVPF
ncbi:hypothetical protein [Methanospirillum sp.]